MMKGTAPTAGAFLTDVRKLRRRARVHMKGGAGTERHQANLKTVALLICEDLVAERIGIDFYVEMIRYFGNDDPTSRRLIEEILAQEEGHAEDLKALIVTLGCGDHRGHMTETPTGRRAAKPIRGRE